MKVLKDLGVRNLKEYNAETIRILCNESSVSFTTLSKYPSKRWTFKRLTVFIYFIEEDRLVRSKGTLVVCPASLLHQWEKEIERRVEPGKLRVLIFHGPKKQRESNARRSVRKLVLFN